jgi:hypothetical protein
VAALAVARLAMVGCLWLSAGASRGADAPLVQGLLAHWEFDEGTGAERILDRSGNGHEATMEGPAGTFRWGREDDRGFFLQVRGEGSTRLQVAPAVPLTGAFSIAVHFAADLAALPQPEAALVWAGAAGAPAYALTIGQDGQTRLQVSGLDRAAGRFATALAPRRDYLLCATYDGANLALYLDGAEVGRRPCTGTVTIPATPLHLGGTAAAPFVGSLYMVRFYDRALSPTECQDLFTSATAGGRSASLPATPPAPAGAASDPLNTPDAIFFTAFSSLEPREAVSLVDTFGKWYHRTGALFMAKDNNVLHIRGGGDVPDLSYAPGLQGRYNLYIGLRGVTAPTAIQIKTTAMERWATVALPEHPADLHVNYDILWARDVAMDDQRLLLHATGKALYLDYLKFVPTDKDAPPAKVEDRFVTLGPRHTAADEIQAQIAKGVFSERLYRDERPLPTLSASAKRRGYVLFTTPWMELVFPGSKPSVDVDTPALQVAAARGEFEPVTFAVHALEAVDGLTVALAGPLVGAAGALPADALDLREVRTLVKRTTNYTGSSEFMDLPCWLEPVSAHALAQGTTRAYWITVAVPRTQPAGTYRGEITVQVAGQAVQSLPLSLTVHPFELAPPGINIGLYYRPLAGLAEPEASLRDMQRHGMTSVAWFGESGLTVSGPPEAPQVRFEGSDLARMLDLFVAAGLSGDFLWCFSGDPIQVYCAKLLPDEAAFERAYAAIIRQILAECGRRQWPRLLFQQYDEVTSNPADFPALQRELRATKLGGGIAQQDHLWLKTSRPIQAQIDLCVPNIDIFTLRYSGKPIFYVDTWPQILETAQRLGRQVYTYNINNGMAIPEMETLRFSAGWFFRSLGAGCRGYYLWAYQFPANDPYCDLEGDTDWILQYPPSADRKGGPALHWEAFREGIDDLRYIVTLETLIAAHRQEPGAAAAVAAAETLLRDLAGSVDVAAIQRDCVFLESRWDRAETLPDGTRVAAGRFRLPSGWSFEKYDEARQAVADHIERLQAAVGGRP